MALQFTRRELVRGAGLAACTASFCIRNSVAAPPGGAVRLASFGADNMGYQTLAGLAKHPAVRLVCVAEVDLARTARLKPQIEQGKVRLYRDWREMLDREHKNLDAACIGTPDHMHALMAMSAMQRGLHVYVQKPLTHDLFETRRLTEFARKKKLVTQMGLQIHSCAEYRSAVQLIQNGVIGKVREVHSWCFKKWGDPDPLPDRSDPVPATLNWDHWLGVAAPRPFIAGYYHPSEWRKRLDFGTGTFGDMGCHIYDPVFGSLALTAPVSVRSEGPAPNRHNWATNAIVRYVFPGTRCNEGKTVNLAWYDGDERPPADIQAAAGLKKLPSQGSLFIGTKGFLLLPHVGNPVLLPEGEFKDLPRLNAEKGNHYFEFLDAVLGKSKTSTAFDYSGPLT